MKVNLEFGGGLEILFGNQKKHAVEIPTTDKTLTVADVMEWAKTELLQEREELFMKGDSIRPGILVLVNDCDWELLGKRECELEDEDEIVFISTLHGG